METVLGDILDRSLVVAVIGRGSGSLRADLLVVRAVLESRSASLLRNDIATIERELERAYEGEDFDRAEMEAVRLGLLWMLEALDAEIGGSTILPSLIDHPSPETES